MMEDTMADRDRRFFLRVPVGYHEMSEDEQKAAAVAMWRVAMVQMGKDPDKLVSENPENDPPDEPGS
jgi:hypothetical protein